jgi:hypothetical protein
MSKITSYKVKSKNLEGPHYVISFTPLSFLGTYVLPRTSVFMSVFCSQRQGNTVIPCFFSSFEGFITMIGIPYKFLEIVA